MLIWISIVLAMICQGLIGIYFERKTRREMTHQMANNGTLHRAVVSRLTV